MANDRGSSSRGKGSGGSSGKARNGGRDGGRSAAAAAAGRSDKDIAEAKASNSGLPANWPPGVVYLTTPVYAGISPPQRRMLQAQQSEASGPRAAALPPLPEVPSILRFGPSTLVEIRTITDPGHPACGQRGLFAARALAAGSFVVPYLGVYHRGHVSVSGGKSGKGGKESDYDLWLDRAADVAVDAARAGNEARFVNDYRGTGRPRPNAEFREVWDPRRGERGMAVFVLPAGKRAVAAVAAAGGRGGGAGGIAKGDEILVSYGKGFWEMRQKEAQEAQEAQKAREVPKEQQKTLQQQQADTSGVQPDNEGGQTTATDHKNDYEQQPPPSAKTAGNTANLVTYARAAAR